MIAVFPGWFVGAQKIQQLLAADSVTGGFHQKSAPTARTDEGVNLSDQVFWQQDVCAYYIHTSSVTPTCDLINCPAIRNSKKRALSARFNVFSVNVDAALLS